MMSAPMPAIAAFYAGLIGILLIILALPISALRRRLKVGVGDGGDPVLERTIRVHANTSNGLCLLFCCSSSRSSIAHRRCCSIPAASRS
jgi:uncharacterized membrane protein YecN with MAPEG domain